MPELPTHEQIDTMTRGELLAALHSFNPFGGYDHPPGWRKVATASLRESLRRYLGVTGRKR